MGLSCLRLWETGTLVRRGPPRHAREVAPQLVPAPTIFPIRRPYLPMAETNRVRCFPPPGLRQL